MPPRDLPPYPILSLPSALKLIADLDDDQFTLLQTEVTGPNAFLRNRKRCEALARSLDVSDAARIFALLHSLSFLYDRAHSWNQEGDAAKEQLRTFLQSFDIEDEFGEDLEKSLDRLYELLIFNTGVDISRKRQWLRTGLLDYASNFSSFVDLRPNFTRDRSRIEGLEISTILGIDVDTETGDRKYHVFQMSEQGVQELKKAVSDILNKIERIRTDSRLSPLLSERTDDGEIE